MLDLIARGIASATNQLLLYNLFKGAQTLAGDLSVIETETIADYKQLDRKDTELFNEVVSGAGASSTYEQAHAGVKMSVTTNNDYVVRQSKVPHNYTSGNPILVELTGMELQPVASTIKRIGYFSSSTIAPYTASLDGWTYETDGTTAWFRVYKFGTVMYEMAQSGWDNPMTSGDTILSLDKFEALVIDTLFLGGTACRFGFLIGDKKIWAHTFRNSNTGASIFVGSPNQFVRYEIRSSGGTANLYHICSKVGSQGKSIGRGISRAYDMGNTFANANTGGTRYALIGVKPNSKNAILTIPNFDAIALTADPFVLSLWLNPTVAGTFTYSAITGLSYDVAYGNTSGNPSTNTVTGGILLASARVVSQGSAVVSVDSLERVGRQMDGTFDSLVLTAMPLGTGALNLDVSAGLNVVQQV